jgi:TolB-like protein/Flp pilus assembly protein TadD/predicted Ser/Thr protein kinase
VDTLIGRTLARYRILEEIGRGGMGVVYRALDVRLDREVAVKVLPPHLVADPERRRRFLQEAQTSSKVEHPNVGVIHEVDEVDGVSFIAMELIRGERLKEMLARGPLSPVRALELATEMAEGLARAHAHGIVHRDLKPGNVMVTADGHAKIIDFGLAKLVDQLSREGDAETVQASEPGLLLGTMSYMSPEQAQSGRVDSRSDIFSFGITLYEMLTAHPPFRGTGPVDVLHAIVRDPAPPLPDGLTGPEMRSDLQRILDKCLEKDPTARYQGVPDLIVDLRGVRRRAESGSTIRAAAVTSIGARPRHVPWRAVAIVAGVAAAAALATALLWPRGTATGAALRAGGKPSLAVMYFQNNTGNEQFNWLRTGLTDLVVTDLSQSSEIEVLGTDRLFQILKDLKRQDDAVVSFDTVQEIARRAGVDHVLLGSYVKSGETLRINVTLQEAATGRIVTAERVEAATDANLFPTVDDLTRRLKTKFAGSPVATPGRLLAPPSTSTDSGMLRTLAEVTTASPEAFQYYVQGVDLSTRAQFKAAIPLFERAIQIDPTFALAMTKLAVAHGNGGHWTLRDQYAKRALDLADRLTPRERYYIEGYYYSHNDDTVGKSIDAYRKAIELYPNHVAAVHNLALAYGYLERSNDAIPLYERLRTRGDTPATVFTNLARQYAFLDQEPKAVEVFQDLMRRTPESAFAYRRLGMQQYGLGELEAAEASLAKADALDGGNSDVAEEHWVVDILRGRFEKARAWTLAAEKSRDSFASWSARLDHAATELYLGRAAPALAALEQAWTGQGPEGTTQTAIARNLAAAMYLALQKPALALTQAQRALDEAAGGEGTWDGAALRAIALADLGRTADAGKALDEFTARANALPSEREKRRVHWVAGRIALDAHQIDKAVTELGRAEAMLLPRGLTGPPPTLHTLIWFALGSAYLARGDDGNAAKRFRLVVDRPERVSYPIEYARSLYFLGQIAERAHQAADARTYYQRFVDLWGNGEIDRDRVEDARKKLAGLSK